MGQVIRRSAVLAAAAMAVLTAGCLAALAVGAGAGALTVAYVGGEGKEAFGEPLERTRLAVIDALEKDMGFSIIEKSGDAVDAHVVAITSERHEVKVHLSRESDKVTMVAIRVGTMGNERLTRLLFEKIGERLKK